MKTFTVHEPPITAADRLERAEQLVFVEDGFSWTAAFLAPLWLLANRLWLPFLAYLVAMGLLLVVIWGVGSSQNIAEWLVLAGHVLIGFEADSIRRWSLKRQDYTMIASVSGRTTNECERRFFEDWLKEQPFLPARVLAGANAGDGREGRLGALSLGLRRG